MLTVKECVNVKVTARKATFASGNPEISEAQKIRAVLEKSAMYQNCGIVWMGAKHPEGKSITHYFKILLGGMERKIRVLMHDAYQDPTLFISDGNVHIEIHEKQGGKDEKYYNLG